MKHVCSWCGVTTKITCDHCHTTLLAADYVGCTFTSDTEAMVCINGPTPLVYSAFAISRMKETHGLCKQCAEKTNDERDALARNRLADALLGQATDKKRGPTGAPKTPTTPANRGPKKP